MRSDIQIFPLSKIDKAVEQSTARDFAHFVTAQNDWSLLNRTVEADAIPACERHGLGQLPYFPLASGMLTGKYRRGEDFAPGTRLAVLPFSQRMASDENFCQG